MWGVIFVKHVFIVNPTSGKGRAPTAFIPRAEAYVREHGLDAEIYVTKAAGDGLRRVEEIAAGGEPVRFYSCGGDGTLYELVNGACRYPNAEIAAIPLGSGNDFARIMGERKALIDLDAQVNGTPAKLDLIRCGERVAINQCSMGLDAEICANQARFKKLPGVSGEAAYTMSLFYCLFRRLNSEFKITVDGETVWEGPTLFALCGNSRWYGGGYKGAPLAVPDDGLLDFIIVKRNMSRLKMVSLVGKYKRGGHIGMDVTIFVRGKKMTVESRLPAAVNIDGECEYVTESCFELLPAAVNFVIPANSAYYENVGRERPVCVSSRQK